MLRLHEILLLYTSEAEVWEGFKSCLAEEAGDTRVRVVNSQATLDTAQCSFRYSLPKFMVPLSSSKALLKGYKTLHMRDSKQTPPSQEERPTQLLKLTEGKKLSLEFLVISCKLHLQPKLQGTALQPQEVSWLCVH